MYLRTIYLVITLGFSYALLSCSEQSSNFRLANNSQSSFGKDSWEANQSNIGFKGKFNIIYFVNEKNGWVGGDKGIFQTNDAGITWNQNNVKMPNNSEITFLFFTDPLNGWAIIQSNLLLQSEIAEFWIISTQNGGASWKTDLNVKNSRVLNMKFSSINSGWLAAMSDTNSVCREPVLFHYQTGKWEKQSAFTDIKTNDENNRCNDLPVSLIPEDKDKITIITERRKLIQSDDNGLSWKKLESFDDKDEQAGIKASGINDKKTIWIVEGTNSTEGTRGKLIVDGKQILLSGKYFSDAVYLGDEKFLVAGNEINDFVDKNAKSNQGRLSSIILYTNDNGENWIDIYKNSNLKGIISMSLIRNTSYNVWGLGSNGEVIHLHN